MKNNFFRPLYCKRKFKACTQAADVNFFDNTVRTIHFSVIFRKIIKLFDPSKTFKFSKNFGPF